MERWINQWGPNQKWPRSQSLAHVREKIVVHGEFIGIISTGFAKSDLDLNLLSFDYFFICAMKAMVGLTLQFKKYFVRKSPQHMPGT